MKWLNKTHVGDCRKLMKRMARDGVRVQTCVTSQPYWGLRDYGVHGQIGLEPTIAQYLKRLVAVFREVHALLTDDGVIWVNMGDSYASDSKWGGSTGGKHVVALHGKTGVGRVKKQSGLKEKDMVGMPWRLAFALQADGWYLRSDIIWAKQNPMPESMRDRPTKSHEYIFLLAKRRKYFYDCEAIRDPLSLSSHARLSQNVVAQRGSDRAYGGTEPDRPMKAVSRSLVKSENMGEALIDDIPGDRNMRTVWTMPTEAFSGAHFATFPRELVRRCVLPSTRPDDIVLDPFMGSGTVSEVATSLGRQFIGCELNPEYVKMHYLRATTIGMPF